MEDDLNKIFAEFERQGIAVTLYARMEVGEKRYLAADLNLNYKVSVSLGLGDRNTTNKSSIEVNGTGYSFRNALTDAFFRIEQMRDTLGWRPQYPDPAADHHPISDDEIPF